MKDKYAGADIEHQYTASEYPCEVILSRRICMISSAHIILRPRDAKYGVIEELAAW